MTNKMKSSFLRVHLVIQKIDLVLHSGTGRHILILNTQTIEAFKNGLTGP